MKEIISFDYAIKYLLKDKGDYEIVEGFISALLSSQGYKPIKIKSLLESESNKESKLLKRSIADVIVEDEEGNNYIVEIDRSYTNLFLHKACFNTSRLIVDHLSANQDYLKIKKVFHINLLYFTFEGNKAPLHHGKVIFHKIDKEHPVDVHL
ncbi:PD-(D/E)XK nuclease family transposase, partial [Cardinium endosymbiont of Culicoides punctatus]|uniref:PD-(D/E)XK nuclease family transposase n=1 Tax=Cardinium endosymbiont of Culicoides punctatus TaxID=2304601 RepID=UPI0010585959